MSNADSNPETVIRYLEGLCANLTQVYNKKLSGLAKCTGTHVEFEKDMQATGEFKLVISFRMEGK